MEEAAMLRLAAAHQPSSRFSTSYWN